MLEIETPEIEFYDEEKNEFSSVKSQKLFLEHSLISISKWESKWKKPFLSQDKKTVEELIDYIKCMTINKNVDPDVYSCLTTEIMTKVQEYIDDPMTATTIKDLDKSNSREIITSEVVYYWMVKLAIPFECQKWHINRLITLVRVYNAKENPKKMSKSEILAQNRELNAARRAKLNTKG